MVKELESAKFFMSTIYSPTYVVTTMAYTALVFVSGTLTWWQPTIIEYSVAWTRGYDSIKELPEDFKKE